MLISKIVSGGQTGVDRGALEAAFELGFPYGGLIPKGRLCELRENPGTAGSIEILCLDKVELSKCGKAHPSHLKVLPFGRPGE